MSLIRLTDETRGDVPAGDQIVEEFPKVGDPEPEFFFSTGGKWRRNSWKGLPLPRGAEIQRFARRATTSDLPAEIPAEADGLIEVLVGACRDALTCLATTTPMGSDKIDDPSVRSAVEAQCDYMDRVRATLRAAIAAAGKGL